jgi:hypothetical protein
VIFRSRLHFVWGIVILSLKIDIFPTVRNSLFNTITPTLHISNPVHLRNSRRCRAGVTRGPPLDMLLMGTPLKELELK